MSTKKEKVVYIAHPVSGDVKGNIDRVLQICREIHTESKYIVPSAPYIATLLYLDDDKADERELGIKANKLLFERGGFQELWLCGNRISPGMRQEVEWCTKLNIPIICYSKELTEEFIHFRLYGVWSEDKK